MDKRLKIWAYQGALIEIEALGKLENVISKELVGSIGKGLVITTSHSFKIYRETKTKRKEIEDSLESWVESGLKEDKNELQKLLR